MAKQGNIWQQIYQSVISFESQLREQNFLIGVAYNIYNRLEHLLSHRVSIRRNVVSVYWGKEITDLWLREGYPLQDNAVFIDETYVSYLNLVEIAEETAKYGHTPKVVDYIMDSTDLKSGEDLDDWLTYNDPFQDAIQELWSDDLLDIWIAEGRMKDYKGADPSNYWNYEDYLKVITVYDYDLNPIVIFITGTYGDYL